MRKYLEELALSVTLMFPTLTFAASKGIGEIDEDTTLKGFLLSIQNWLVGFVGVLTVLFIVYGGFLYVTSGGNKERIEKAKKTLTYAIMGLVLVILASLILSILTGGFLTSIFGSKSLSL